MLLSDIVNMTRKQIESTFKDKISGKAGKDGTTFLATTSNGHRYAIKLFKPTKSTTFIVKEAKLQQMAADNGVAPVVRGVSEVGKFIVMDALKETIVDKANREKWTSLPRDYKAMLYALCVRLDKADVLQNDGNPLNLMVDETGRLYIIDYGFATEIDNKMKKKRGAQPNVALTMWDFGRRLKYYKITNDLQMSILNKYKENHAYKDEPLLARGEKLLGGDYNGTSNPSVLLRTKSSAKSVTKSSASPVPLGLEKLNVQAVTKTRRGRTKTPKSRRTKTPKGRRSKTPPSRTRPSTRTVLKKSTIKKATFTQHAKPPALTLKEKIQMRVDRHNNKKKNRD